MPIKFCSEAHLFLGSRTPSLKSLPEDLCSGFLLPEKTHRPQPGLNPRTLELEASTLSRDHRSRHNQAKKYGNSTQEIDSVVRVQTYRNEVVVRNGTICAIAVVGLSQQSHRCYSRIQALSCARKPNTNLCSVKFATLIIKPNPL